ncbi:MAG: hypothetical protein JXM70_14650, partial [Pirellulales bacterium]|nr:hypothetical protein [Pirellulales bacterium]
MTPINKQNSNTSSRQVTGFQKRLLEAFDTLWNDFVDPVEPFFDSDGEQWSRIGFAANAKNANSGVPKNETELADIRDQCRTLAAENEFAINGHENRINFIVGTG